MGELVLSRPEAYRRDAHADWGDGVRAEVPEVVARGRFARHDGVEMVFIRAPYITAAGPDVEILAEIGGRAVAAREGRMLAAAFHPEMTRDLRVLEYFLAMARA